MARGVQGGLPRSITGRAGTGTSGVGDIPGTGTLEGWPEAWFIALGCMGSRESDSRGAGAGAAGAWGFLRVRWGHREGPAGLWSSLASVTLQRVHVAAVLLQDSVWDTLKSFSLHFLFSHQQGKIFEKLGICSMPGFVRFMHDLMPLKEDPDVVVTDLRFGTIPVKLYQPKASSCSLRPGVVLYHGGGGIIGSMSKFFPQTRRTGTPQSRDVGTVLPAGGSVFLGSNSCWYDQGAAVSGPQITQVAKIWNILIFLWK